MNGRVTRAYRYRLYPTKVQAAALDTQLGFACDLYNAALEQRRGAWREQGRSVRLNEQMRELTALRAEPGAFPEGMGCAATRDPLRRLDRAFAAFFRRVKAGEKPGYPRFRSRRRYDSLSIPVAHGATVHDGRLQLAGVGAVRVRWHRPLPEASELREATLRRSAGRWYVSFALTMPAPAPLPGTGRAVGLDLGIRSFVALSDGQLLPGPRAERTAAAAVRRAQRKVARRRKGSNRRRKAVALLTRAKAREYDLRRDHAHKLSHALVRDHDLIVHEALSIRALAGGMLARDVADAGWGGFLLLLTYKAVDAGRSLVAVDPRGTSQRCCACGALPERPKRLGERTHRCACGCVLDRDLNAARNILAAGMAARAPTAAMAAVVREAA